MTESPQYKAKKELLGQLKLTQSLLEKSDDYAYDEFALTFYSPEAMTIDMVVNGETKCSYNIWFKPQEVMKMKEIFATLYSEKKQGDMI